MLFKRIILLCISKDKRALAWSQMSVDAHVILDCLHHPAYWEPIMRKAPTPSGQQSTGSLFPATQCSAGSSAMSSTSCCEMDIQTYVMITHTHTHWLLICPWCSFVCFVPYVYSARHPHNTVMFLINYTQSDLFVALIRLPFSVSCLFALFLLSSLQVIKDSMRNKADLTDMSRMWVRTQKWLH